MYKKRAYIEAWHISEDGLVSLCGLNVRQAVEQADTESDVEGERICARCHQLDNEKSPD